MTSPKGLTGGGAVNIDSKGSIITNGLINTSATAVNGQYLGNGGDVRLLANGNITFNPSSGINSVGLLGGNITLTSNGDISFTNADANSYSYTNVPGTTGGDINVTASSIFLRNDSDLLVQTFGQGNAGRVKITASELVSEVDDNSIRSDVESGASGNSGGIELTAKTLLLSGGSVLTSSTYGAGSSGDVRVTTSGVVKIDGENSQGDISRISSNVELNGTGNSGGIYLNAGSLSLTNGAQILASTFGQGNAGRLKIDVSGNVLLDGEGGTPTSGLFSGLFSVINPEANGDGGNLNSPRFEKRGF